MVNISQENMRAIRLLELKARKMVRGLMSGETISRHKGFGLEFDQLSEYQFGDDVRFIDWKSTARSNKIMIRNYREELNRTIFLLIDISGSTWYGSQHRAKNDIIAEIAVMLSLAGLYCKDAVGALFFSDQVDAYLPPRASFSQFHAIASKSVEFKKKLRHTDLSQALSFLARVARRESLVFIISDCLDDHYIQGLKTISRKHDVAVIRCLDQAERELPPLGFVHCLDSESDESALIDMRSKSEAFLWQQEYHQQTVHTLKQLGVDCFDITPQGPVLEKLIMYLAQRG